MSEKRDWQRMVWFVQFDQSTSKMEYESEISLLILLGARSWLPTITAVVSGKKWSLLRDGIIHVITIYIIYSSLFPNFQCAVGPAVGNRRRLVYRLNGRRSLFYLLFLLLLPTNRIQTIKENQVATPPFFWQISLLSKS